MLTSPKRRDQLRAASRSCADGRLSWAEIAAATESVYRELQMTRPLFIVACDRSGTTLLRLILDRSPVIAIPTESMFLADMDQRRARYGDLSTDEQFDRWCAATWARPVPADRYSSAGPAQ